MNRFAPTHREDATLSNVILTFNNLKPTPNAIFCQAVFFRIFQILPNIPSKYDKYFSGPSGLPPRLMPEADIFPLEIRPADVPTSQA
jgi:hypothetical protein